MFSKHQKPSPNVNNGHYRLFSQRWLLKSHVCKAWCESTKSYWNHTLSRPERHAQSRLVCLWFSRLDRHTQAEVLLLTLFLQSWSDLLTASELRRVLDVFVQLLKLSLSPSWAAEGRHAVRQSSLSLSETKVCLFSRESHSSVSSLFPSQSSPCIPQYPHTQVDC